MRSLKNNSSKRKLSKKNPIIPDSIIKTAMADLTFPGFDSKFYEGISQIEINEVKKGIELLLVSKDYTAFGSFKSELKEIVKNNLLTHMETLKTRVYQKDVELKKANMEFKLQYDIFSKLFHNPNDLAKALYIKFNFNFDSYHYEVALKVANEMIQLDPHPRYYHARVRIYNALGSYALALEDAKVARDMAQQINPKVDIYDHYQALDNFYKALRIDPNNELTEIAVEDVRKKIETQPIYSSHQLEMNTLNYEEKKQDAPKKKLKKKKKKKNPKELPTPKSLDSIKKTKETILAISTSLTTIIDDKDTKVFEVEVDYFNQAYHDAKLIQHEKEGENREFQAFLSSNFNKLFLKIQQKIQKLEKKNEDDAIVFYQNVLALTPLNADMRLQINGAIKRLQKKNQKQKQEQETRLKDEAKIKIIQEKIKKLGSVMQYNLDCEALHAELMPDKYHESEPERIKNIYNTYLKIDLLKIAEELKEELTHIHSKDLKAILLTEQKELTQRISYQQDIIDLYKKIKDNEIRRHHSLIKNDIEKLRLLHLKNQRFVKEIKNLKIKALENPDSAKAELLIIQNEIKTNAQLISTMNACISKNLTTKIRIKTQFVSQVSKLKQEFKRILIELKRDETHYFQAKMQVEQHAKLIEQENLPVKKLLNEAHTLCESKNELGALKKKHEDLQKMLETIRVSHKKLSQYPYFAHLIDIHQTLATVDAKTKHTEKLIKTYDILHATDAFVTLDEKCALSEKYKVIWRGGDAQLVGAMLYTDEKTARSVELNDSDPLIMDESPSKIAEKLTTENKYQLNNPELKSNPGKKFKAKKHNYIQLLKTIVGKKNGLPIEKKIDLTVGHEGTYTQQFITGLAAGRLIIFPADTRIDENNYDVIHLANHKLCIDKTDKYHADFKFACTHKTYLLTRYDKEIHKNHSYVAVKNYKKMMKFFGEDNVIKNAEDRLAGDGKTTVISYDKYLNELPSVFTKLYERNAISCFQEVNSLVTKYGFRDKDVKPFLNALIKAMIKNDLAISQKAREVKDQDKFIEEVILHLSILHPNISDVKKFDSAKLNSVILMTIKTAAKHRLNPSDTTIKFIENMATSLGIVMPEVSSTNTSKLNSGKAP